MDHRQSTGNTLLPEKTDSDGLTLRRLASVAQGGDRVRTAERPGKGELCSKAPF